MTDEMKIKCQDCGHIFIFSAQEQKFYEEHGYVPPKRCRYCRNKRKVIFNERRRNNG